MSHFKFETATGLHALQHLDSMKKISLYIFATIAFLQGCANTDTNTYVAPANSQMGTLTSVEVSEGFYKFHGFRAIGIDGKSAGPQSPTEGKNVQAGERLIQTEARFRMNSKLGPYRADMFVTANLKAGRKYRVNGKFLVETAQTWIEDAETQERVSNTAEARWRKEASPATLLPIPIPGGGILFVPTK